MPEKNTKMSMTNFEKMKKEMNIKKQKAMLQQKAEVTIENSSANIIPNQVDENLMNRKQKNRVSKFLIFKVGIEEFALTLTDVKEIVRVPPLYKIPNSPQYIAGLFSLRGVVIPVINSRNLFGMVEIQHSFSSRIIVTDIHGRQVGIVADKTSQIVDIDEGGIKEPPSSIKKLDKNLVKGMLILDNGNRIVMVLNCEKIAQKAQ